MAGRAKRKLSDIKSRINEISNWSPKKIESGSLTLCPLRLVRLSYHEAHARVLELTVRGIWQRKLPEHLTLA